MIESLPDSTDFGFWIRDSKLLLQGLLGARGDSRFGDFEVLGERKKRGS
jgi:hypothetical protein